MKDNYSINIHNLTVSLFVNKNKEKEDRERNKPIVNQEGIEIDEDGIKSFEFGEQINDNGDRPIESRDRDIENDLNNKSSKPWFLSKTILSNSAALIGLLAIHISENQESYSTILPVSVLAIINIFLRFVTKDPLKFK